MQINVVIVKDMVQLDITGPYEVLARAPGWTVDLVAESMEPVRTDRGRAILSLGARPVSNFSRTPDTHDLPKFERCRISAAAGSVCSRG